MFKTKAKNAFNSEPHLLFELPRETQLLCLFARSPRQQRDLIAGGIKDNK